MVTIAWAKLFEILLTFPQLLPSPVALQGVPLRSLHLCEAPGAFILALNHFLHTHTSHHVHRWHWTASSLNPYYEGNDYSHMIADDRLISSTEPHWFYGAANSGDLTQLCLRQQLRQLGSFHFATADGSVDCMHDPGNQERDTYPLQLLEAVTAMQSLHPGGSLVLKRFTLFLPESAALLFLLSSSFRHTSLHKPLSSKCGNSEHYVICSGFISLPQSVLHAFESLDPTDLAERPVLPLNQLPLPFLRRLFAIAKGISLHQTEFLRFNLSAYNLKLHQPDLYNDLLTNVSNLRHTATRTFIRKHRVHGTLQPQQLLLSGRQLRGRPWFRELPDQHWSSTLILRQSANLSLNQASPSLLLEHEMLTQTRHRYAVATSSPISLQDFPASALRLPVATPVFGRSFPQLNTSRFVNADLLQVFRRLSTQARPLQGDEADAVSVGDLGRMELCNYEKVEDEEMETESEEMEAEQTEEKELQGGVAVV